MKNHDDDQDDGNAAPQQPTLPGFDRSPPREPTRRITNGRELRDNAIERALDHAGDKWQILALEVIRTTAEKYEEFFSDDYLRVAGALALPPPPDPRSWGGIVRRAKYYGWISKTGELRESARAVCHAAPKPVYRSHIFRGRRPER